MTDQLSWSAVGEWFAGFAPEGPLRSAVLLVYGLCVAVAPFIYKYYLGVLAQGAQPEGSVERQDYDRLRASLAGDNLAARLYAKWLTAFLDRVERFFGDAGTEGQRAFGLKTPAPLWTAPAFDRCLLLAFIYPIVTIFIIWAISGHVGPAETALGLTPDLSGWRRGLAAVMIGFAVFGFVHAYRATTWKSIAWSWKSLAWLSVGALGLLGGARTGELRGALISFGAFFLWFTSTGYRVVAFNGAGIVITAISFTVVMASIFAVSATGVIYGVQVVIIFASILTVSTIVELLSISAIQFHWHGFFLSFFLPAAILTCLVATDLLSHLETWELAGPLLLFVGLLTLLNAPFDWASLGLTRALLRRGLELGGWWPYLLALVDAALAAVIIAALALVAVIGVQAFDELAVHGGGKAVLPLDALFDGIAKNPTAPEYWWAYALLVSSMIPSIINLAIGGMAFTRGIPWLAQLLLQWIPEGKAVPEYKRQLAAIGLTAQMFAGVGLGIAAQGFLALVIIHYAIPLLGLDLLDMARAVADFDLPMQLWQIFARIL